MYEPFKLKATIGTAYRAESDDVFKVKNALRDDGYYTPPTEFGITDFTDRQMFDGLKAFQRDNALSADGIARTGGPTELALRSRQARKVVDQKGGRPAPKAGVFGLAGGIGPGQRNAATDKKALKRALTWTNTLTPREAERDDDAADTALSWGLWRFQRQHGLTQDGIVIPNGPTAQRIDALITPLVQHAVIQRDSEVEASPTPQPEPTPEPDPQPEPEPEPGPETPTDPEETPPNQPEADEKPDTANQCEAMRAEAARILEKERSILDEIKQIEAENKALGDENDTIFNDIRDGVMGLFGGAAVHGVLELLNSGRIDEALRIAARKLKKPLKLAKYFQMRDTISSNRKKIRQNTEKLPELLDSSRTLSSKRAAIEARIASQCEQAGGESRGTSDSVR